MYWSRTGLCGGDREGVNNLKFSAIDNSIRLNWIVHFYCQCVFKRDNVNAFNMFGSILFPFVLYPSADFDVAKCLLDRQNQLFVEIIAVKRVTYLNLYLEANISEFLIFIKQSINKQ